MEQTGAAMLLAASTGGRIYMHAGFRAGERSLRGGILVVGCVEKEGGGRKGLSGMYKTCHEYIDRTL